MTVKESVLAALEQNRGEYLSGEKLSDDLGVSRTAVWKAIRSLRQEGFPIDAVTNRGYCLADREESFSAEEIRRYLPSRYKGNPIHVYDTIDSTNLRARQIAAEAAMEKAEDIHGMTVAARQQTAGRGRLGRSFFSPSEGIYISIVVRPDFDLSSSVLVTVAAAAAVAEAVDGVCDQEEDTQIKWVNDIYLKGRKICGILTEGVTDFETGQIENLIIGIGINTSLKDFPDELKKTAGAVEGEWSRSALVAEIITRVMDHMKELSEADTEKKHPTFMPVYRNKSMLIGRDILVYKGSYRKDPGDEMAGVVAKAVAIEADGGLRVKYKDGTEEVLTTGEVTVRSTD